jgi:hypothetical protein
MHQLRNDDGHFALLCGPLYCAEDRKMRVAPASPYSAAAAGWRVSAFCRLPRFGSVYF